MRFAPFSSCSARRYTPSFVTSTTFAARRRNASTVKSRRYGSRTGIRVSSVNFTGDVGDVRSVLAYQLSDDARISSELLHVVRFHHRLPWNGRCGAVGCAAPISLDERLAFSPDG